ncbi:MAG: histidinol-phosphate transaminase [Candidatus Palauibacterales bacterium]|nr:histidinol-phosphate transaminase [Candidatus Palauibacterales bacterium]
MSAGDPASLVRPHLREVEPYTTARSSHTGGLLLDANENRLGTLVPELGEDLNQYPDPRTPELRSALADRLSVSEGELWIGNGSDEGIDVLLRALVDPGDAVAVVEPTYGVYRTRARTYGADVRRALLDEDLRLDVEAAAGAAAGAKALFLCSPNNPTGTRLSREGILELADRVDALVVADEAYVEYAGGPSLAGEVRADRNLAVLRTFSKAWGLAGARVGYLAAPAPLVPYLDLAGLPYPVSKLSSRAAVRTLERSDEMERRVAAVREERERIAARLREMGLRVLPSESNFLLFFVGDPGRVQGRMASEEDVVIRNRSDLPRLDGALRVTVGRREENDRFLEALERTLDQLPDAAGGAGGRP